MSQITYIPKNDFNGVETTNSNTTWYAKNGKPLKIWRKRGYSNSLGTKKSSDGYDCSGCSSNFIIGTEFKMLGKYISPSSISANPKRDVSGCISVDNTRGPVGTRGVGNVISFSGGSRIRSSVTFLNKKYCGNTAAYLQSRNLDYKSNTFKSKYPGVNYYNNDNYVVNEYNWPDNTELSSSLYKGKSCKSNGLYNKVYETPGKNGRGGSRDMKARGV